MECPIDSAVLTSPSCSGNGLNGSIPTELFPAGSRLQKLDLGNNKLTGSIPTTISNASDLQGLFLYGNGLAGSLPSEIGGLRRLLFLRLQRNEFHNSSIPTSWGSLTSLRELWLYSTGLTGPIPSEIGEMTALTSLRVRFCVFDKRSDFNSNAYLQATQQHDDGYDSIVTWKTFPTRRVRGAVQQIVRCPS